MGRMIFLDRPMRKSPRISNFDYARDNYYFVTICTYDKRCIFGSINSISRYGKIAAESIRNLSGRYSGVKIDKFVVMPNHVHIIIIIGCNNKFEQNPSLEQVVGLYKSGVSREIHKLNSDISVWQRSFHDHVIRNQADYERIWSYIDTNPIRWEKDCFYTEG